MIQIDDWHGTDVQNNYKCTWKQYMYEDVQYLTETMIMIIVEHINKTLTNINTINSDKSISISILITSPVFCPKELGRAAAR